MLKSDNKCAAISSDPNDQPFSVNGNEHIFIKLVSIDVDYIGELI